MAKPKVFNKRAWIISALRRASMRWPPIYEAANRAKEVYYITSKSGKPLRRVRFICEVCKTKVSTKDRKLDHRIPVVGEEGFPLLPDGSDNWNAYIDRLLCSTDNISVKCTNCHNIKSKLEREQKALIRKEKKKSK